MNGMAETRRNSGASRIPSVERTKLAGTMKFSIEITLGNDAMQSGQDVANAVRVIAAKVERLGTEPLGDDFDGENGRVKDENGNTVGEWGIG